MKEDKSELLKQGNLLAFFRKNGVRSQSELLKFIYGEVYGNDEKYIEWHGGKTATDMPCLPEDTLDVVLRGSYGWHDKHVAKTRKGHEIRWNHNGYLGDVIAFRFTPKSREAIWHDSLRDMFGLEFEDLTTY
jgi:hypothetical protein